MLHTFDLNHLMASSPTGPILEAEIVSLAGKGKLRVTYNWLYSALNCDPNDNSPFIWVFTKRDDHRVCISPKVPYEGKTLYASVRDDWNWNVQVQAPRSADWIKAIGRDEILSFKIHDLSIASLQGFNDKFLSVNHDIDVHDWHKGYRVRSAADGFNQNEKWFIGIQSPALMATRQDTKLADLLKRNHIQMDVEALTSSFSTMPVPALPS